MSIQGLASEVTAAANRVLLDASREPSDRERIDKLVREYQALQTSSVNELAKLQSDITNRLTSKKDELVREVDRIIR